MEDRAAQFAPFRALEGYEDEVAETARLTDEYRELDVTRQAEISDQLAWIAEHLTDNRLVSVTFFIPDGKKDGGRYETITGIPKKIDNVSHKLTLENGNSIPMHAISDLSILPETETK